jgi:hypothetical protein
MKAAPVALLALLLLAVAGRVAAADAEPDVKRTVVEDDQVRIEELRVRGAVQQVVVHNKKGSAPDYQIVLPRAGREGARERDAAGQRVWRLLSF